MVQIEIAGLSKLIVSNHYLRIFWIIVLLICFSCFSGHFYLQLSRYLSYEKVSDTNHKDNGFRFPDVTICPTEPYDKVRLEQHNVRKIHSDLLKLWTSILPEAMPSSSKDQQSRVFEQQLAIWEAAQHSLSFGVNKFSSVLRNLEENLVFCQFQNKICSAANFKLFRHPVKQNCYTFQPADDMRQMTHPGENSGLFLVLNMSGSASLLSPVEKISHRIGYMVDLHPKGTKPQFQTASFLASINQQTNAEVSMTTVKDISTPIDRCQTDKRNIEVVSDFSKQPWSYNTYTQVLGDCRESELQMQLEIFCKCWDETLIISSHQKTSFCHSLPQKFWDQLTFNLSLLTATERSNMKERALCYIKESEKFKNYILDVAQCYNPCDKIIYSKMVTSNQWPNNYPVEEALNQIKYGQNMMNFSGNSDSNAMPSRNLGLLAVKVFPPSLTSVEIEKKREFDWVELVSEGGGIIGLWIGWCVFTIFEIVEWCLKVTVCTEADEEEKKRLAASSPSITTRL